MARPEPATELEINYRLKELPLWERQGNKIVREIAAANFAAVIGIVNAVALMAEKMDHHPDMLIYGWNKLRITLSTHDRGALTELDFDLAKQIELLNY